MNTSLTITRSVDDWLALDVDGRIAGRATVSTRSAELRLISIDAWTDAAFDRLADVVLAESDAPSATLADAADESLLEQWRRHGFVESRRTGMYRFPLSRPVSEAPTGVTLRREGSASAGRVVAECDGRDVGSLRTTPRRRGIVRLEGLVVAERLRRRGIASAVLGEALAWLGEVGASMVVAEFDDANAAATALVRAAGTVRIESTVELVRGAE